MAHTALYFLALLSLSTASSWAKLSAMPVDVLGFWRLFVAALVVLLITRFKKTSLKWPRQQGLWVIASGVFFFLHLFTYKYAAKTTTIANTMIIFATNPVWSSAGATLFFAEKITPRLLFSYSLAFLGLLVMFYPQINLSAGFNTGDLSAVLSAFLYAAYMLTGKKARLHTDNSCYAFYVYGVCAFLFLLSSFTLDHPLTGYSTISWVAVAGLVLIPTLLGHMSLTYLVNHMSLTVMTCGKLIEPIFAAIIAYFLFSEHLTWTSWVAFLFTVISVFVLFEKDLRQVLKKM